MSSDKTILKNLKNIEKFLNEGHYEEAIEKSFKIVEKCLETLYGQVFLKLNLETQLNLLNDLKDNYSGKNFNDLTIGDKLKIFDVYKIPSYLKINLSKEVNPKTLLALNTIRVDSTHQKREITKGDAYYCYSIILRFLEKIGAKDLLEISEKVSLKQVISDTVKEKNYIPENLPHRDYIEFIGREKEIEETIRLLKHQKVHVLSIDGIGGVGKSSLALEVGYKLKENNLFDAIIWVSAKQYRLTYRGIEEIENTLGNKEDLFDEILKIFNEFDFIKLGSIKTKENKVLEILKENHCLLIVDNLETIYDENLKKFLIDLRFPIESKVLITSRKRLGEVEYVEYLEKFELEDTQKYIESQLKARQFSRKCSEELLLDIHEKTGGIPLAIKIIIPWIVEGKVKDKLEVDISKETDILSFCFDKIYNEFLDEDAMRLFVILSLAPTEMTEAALRFISGLDDTKYNASLGALITYSLVSIMSKNGADDLLYMLPLTQEFGKKISKDNFPNLKDDIHKSYLKFLELSESKKYSAKKAISINKAEEARRLSSSGEIEGAKKLFKESISYDPECDYALYLYSVFCREREDFGQGKSLIERALKINNTNPYYWSEYITIVESSGDFKRAEKIAEKALKMTSHDRFLVIKLIFLKSKLQKNDDVLKLANDYIMRDATDKKEIYLNTRLTVALLEGHWRKASNISKEGRIKDALNMLLDGLRKYQSLRRQRIIFSTNNKILWEIKKTYRKLGDHSLVLKKNNDAIEYYRKSIYRDAYYEDRKKHNRIILKKLNKLIKKQEEIN